MHAERPTPEAEILLRRTLRRRTPWKALLADCRGDGPPGSARRAFSVELSELEAARLFAPITTGGGAEIVIHDVSRESEVLDAGIRSRLHERVTVRITSLCARNEGGLTLHGSLHASATTLPLIARAEGGPLCKPPRLVPVARRSNPMSINYDPHLSLTTWPDGLYAAHIEAAEEKTSRAGNRMIEFTFVCFHRLHGITRVWEHVVIPKQLWKLRLLAAAINRPDAFQSGSFRAADYVGAHLELELNTEQSRRFPPRNVIVEFLQIPGEAGSFGSWRDDLVDAIAGSDGEEPL